MTQILLTKLSKSILYRYLFYKHYYKFIFLHKPLCERYKNSTIKLFGVYFCRSCSILYIGLALGIWVVLSKIQTVQFDRYFFLGLSGALLTLFASYPPIYSRFSRLSKDFVRFYDGLFLGIILIISFKIGVNTGVASIILFILFKRIYNKKRGGKRICEGCSELEKGKTCQGYKEQKQAFLDLEQEYSEIMTGIILKQRKDFRQ